MRLASCRLKSPQCCGLARPPLVHPREDVPSFLSHEPVKDSHGHCLPLAPALPSIFHSSSYHLFLTSCLILIPCHSLAWGHVVLRVPMTPPHLLTFHLSLAIFLALDRMPSTVFCRGAQSQLVHAYETPSFFIFFSKLSVRNIYFIPSVTSLQCISMVLPGLQHTCAAFLNERM